MARKVFENSMVAHVWAQQNQDEGRSNNGQFYFVGPVLYSYGSHFVVGVFDRTGRAWLNTDGYSPTTGKHKSYAYRAVTNYFSVPSLTGIYRAIQDMGDPSRAAWVKREITSYMDSNWRAFPADSDAGAALWAAVSPRGSWSAERARRDAKAAKDSARADRLNKAAGLRTAREVAAIPLDMVRLRLIQVGTESSDWSKERDLKRAVAFYQDAHKASAPGSKVRAAVWERVKLAREIAARLLRHSGKGPHAKTRGAVVTLRRLWAGDYGAGTPLNYALAERKALEDAKAAHMPPAMRNRLVERLEAVSRTIAEETAREDAERMERERAERLAWYAGERVASRYALKGPRGSALIRAVAVELDGCRVIGGTLETSQGATAPLSHAVRVFGFVRAIRERGEAWSRTGAGPRAGHFTVDSVEPDGSFRAGCHYIAWEETERLARELGVWDCPADELAGQGEAEAA